MHSGQQRVCRKIHSTEIWSPSFERQCDRSLHVPQPRSELLVDNSFNEDIGECLVTRVTSGVSGQLRQPV